MMDRDSLERLLRRFRLNAGLTQAELAEQAGVSVYTVSNLERGALHRPRSSTLDLLAKALDLADDDRAEFLAAARALRADLASPQLTNAGSTVTAHSGPALSRLPRPPTPLIGREEARAVLDALLLRDEVRLITMTGPGGVGKTHLALEVARDVAMAFPDGVVFVDLAPLRQAAQVLPAIVRAWGVQEQRAPDETLRAVLMGKRALLILDNFEHLLDAAVHLADLLAACGSLHVLVTSRSPLRLRGEHCYDVTPLAVPDIPHPLALEDLACVPSVALFLARAQAVSSAFVLTAANSPAIAGVCIRLDGLPLAIELAAARIQHVPPTDLLMRLEHRLDLLTNGPRDLPLRQQTLRNTLEWSYSLLSSEEQALFRQLAVFARGASLAAIAAVCPVCTVESRSGVGARSAQELLWSLMEHSLIFQAYQQDGAADKHLDSNDTDDREDGGDMHDMREMKDIGNTRVLMLETIREYTSELLAASGEQDVLAQRHASFYLAMAEREAQCAGGPDQVAAFRRLDREWDNLRAALQWTLARHDGVTALRLVAALSRFCYVRGYLSEGRSWSIQALALVPDTADTPNTSGEGPDKAAPGMRSWRIEALRGLGMIAMRQGDLPFALEVTESALAAQRAVGDDEGVARSLNVLGIIAREQGQHAHAHALWTQSLALRRALHDDNGIGLVLGNLATVAHERGAYAEAARCYEESLRYIRDPGAIAMMRNNWGVVEGQRGKYAQATQLAEEALAQARTLGEKLTTAVTLQTLGELARQQGRADQARAYCDEGLALAREVGDQEHIANVLMTFHSLAVARRDQGVATDVRRELVSIYSARLRVRREHGDRQGIADTLFQLATLARDEQNWRGAQTSLREALAIFSELEMEIRIAGCLEELAGVAVAGMAWEQAARWFGAAWGIRERTRAPLAPVDASRYRALMAPAWAALGTSRAEAVRARSRATLREEVVREALGS